ncbi:hypothetical protein FKP32DRAFT_518865 [Trametes sanguinea]|nr:hypothetical protein FKP32DRAFT_518865 [Trametes sanguinea]
MPSVSRLQAGFQSQSHAAPPFSLTVLDLTPLHLMVKSEASRDGAALVRCAAAYHATSAVSSPSAKDTARQTHVPRNHEAAIQTLREIRSGPGPDNQWARRGEAGLVLCSSQIPSVATNGLLCCAGDRCSHEGWFFRNMLLKRGSARANMPEWDASIRAKSEPFDMLTEVGFRPHIYT